MIESLRKYLRRRASNECWFLRKEAKGENSDSKKKFEFRVYI